MTRQALDDAPVRYVGETDYLDVTVQVLFTQTEFGVVFAVRENERDTWSPPIHLEEVPQ